MPQTLNKAPIRRIALCSQGNAHLPVEFLRLAAERAEDNNTSRMLAEHIEFAVGSAKSIYSTRSASKLNEHQRLLLQIIKGEREVPASELSDKYQQKSANPPSERTIGNYLHEFEKYGFIRMKDLEEAGFRYTPSRRL